MSTSSYAHPQDDLLPVVILLMEDIRCAGPEPDYQLAEVNVSLRPHVGDDQTGGWWADGEEVMKALQLTPSRLEGPPPRLSLQSLPVLTPFSVSFLFL